MHFEIINDLFKDLNLILHALLNKRRLLCLTLFRMGGGQKGPPLPVFPL